MKFWISSLSVFLASALTGAAFMVAPAASTLLLDPSYKDLGTTYYGFISLFVCIGAIVASLWTGKASSILGLKWVVIIGLVTHAASMLLFSSTFLVTEKWLDILLYAIALFLSGAAFGATLTACNVVLFRQFHGRFTAIISAFYAALGAGTVLSPILFHHYMDIHNWWIFPFTFSVAFCVNALMFFLSTENHKIKRESEEKIKNIKPLLYLITYMLIYGLIFALIVGWTMPFLSHMKGLDAKIASISLGLFWTGVTVGRLITTLLSFKVKATTLYLALPPLMVASFFLFYGIHDERSAYIAYALVGLAASSGFPLTFKFGEEIYPTHASRVSGLLMANYMTGYGVGVYLIGVVMHLEILFEIAFILPLVLVAISIPPTRAYDKRR